MSSANSHIMLQVIFEFQSVCLYIKNWLIFRQFCILVAAAAAVVVLDSKA